MEGVGGDGIVGTGCVHVLEEGVDDGRPIGAICVGDFIVVLFGMACCVG